MLNWLACAMRSASAKQLGVTGARTDFRIAARRFKRDNTRVNKAIALDIQGL